MELPGQEEDAGYHGQLASLHSQIEGEQRREERPDGEARIQQDTGEAQSMDQPEPEDHLPTPRRRIFFPGVLPGDQDDGGRDQRLDHESGKGQDPLSGQPEGQGMGEGKGRDLHQQVPHPTRPQAKAKDEKNMVEPQGKDMDVSQAEESSPSHARHGDRTRPMEGLVPLEEEGLFRFPPDLGHHKDLAPTGIGQMVEDPDLQVEGRGERDRPDR